MTNCKFFIRDADSMLRLDAFMQKATRLGLIVLSKSWCKVEASKELLLLLPTCPLMGFVRRPFQLGLMLAIPSCMGTMLN